MGRLERHLDQQKVEQVLQQNPKIEVLRTYQPTDPKPACTRWPTPPYREKLARKRRTGYARTG